jgi:hypothetical protein
LASLKQMKHLACMSSEDICFAVLYSSLMTSFDVLPSTSKITVGTQVILPSFVSLIESQISPKTCADLSKEELILKNYFDSKVQLGLLWNQGV